MKKAVLLLIGILVLFAGANAYEWKRAAEKLQWQMLPSAFGFQNGQPVITQPIEIKNPSGKTFSFDGLHVDILHNAQSIAVIHIQQPVNILPGTATLITPVIMPRTGTLINLGLFNTQTQLPVVYRGTVDFKGWRIPFSIPSTINLNQFKQLA